MELMCKMISEERIMGFVEGEGCFSIGIGKYIDRRSRKGRGRFNIKNPRLFRVNPSFRITLCREDRQILEEIKETLGFGKIYTQKRSLKYPEKQDVDQYYAQGFESCQKAKDFFQRQKFYTRKGKDFQLWCQALEILKSDKKLKKEDILEICKLRDQMNFRKTKNKRSTKEIEQILNAKPIHQTAYFNEKQAELIHNNNLDLKSWLAKKPGNHIKGRPEPETEQNKPNTEENQIESQKTTNTTQNNTGI